MTDNNQLITFENTAFQLLLSKDCKAVSLSLKRSNEQCIKKGEELPFFTLTEERPYNNEIKLAHPNKRTTFCANRVRLENGKLIVGFELITFEAVIDVKVAPLYMTFTLEDFIIKPEDFAGLDMTPPPVYEFRLVQLPVKSREHFGEWLNVMWDGKAAVNVLATDPYARIDSEKRKDYRVLYGETLRDVKLKDSGVALIVSDKDSLLDAIDSLERDYGLPLGVESRRSGLLNRSYYWSPNILPENVDRHIKYAKQAGFKNMLIYYESIVKYKGPYYLCGEYEVRDEFGDGYGSVREMLKKIKDAGITPGLHILHSHVGLMTKYVTPVADYRLNTTKKFRLSRPLSATDTEVYVEEDPTGSVTADKCRVLMFMGELISYEGYTTERPYKFYGCKRGHCNTNVRTHELGEWGGILDISEFCASSAYIDQSTSLQDEIADSIAKLWDCGFEFMYYDGSEGTDPPFEINVPLAQYRVFKKLSPAPIYCEGAAKAHFSWHMITGGNAFDIFPTPIFKDMIVEHPLKEAPLIGNDFTRCNFGWWAFAPDMRADVMEYGTSKAASYDCPGAFRGRFDRFESHPRTDDILEVLRRWEDVRENGFLTEERKLLLRDPHTEYTLIVNEAGEYEMIPVREIDMTAVSMDITAFTFERNGKGCAAIWNNTGSCSLSLPVGGADIVYRREFTEPAVTLASETGCAVISVSSKHYIESDLTESELGSLLRKSKLI